jgi:V/A-type H+-transporting ATPase subunit D
VLDDVRFHKAEYSMLAKPFWVDFLVELLQKAATLSIRRNIEQQRVRRLNEAVRRITQRVNLFEKVLIPQAEKDIQRIRIYLADAERAAVVRSKIAKAKQPNNKKLRAAKG